jgi:hypothetical protein
MKRYSKSQILEIVEKETSEEKLQMQQLHL